MAPRSFALLLAVTVVALALGGYAVTNRDLAVASTQLDRPLASDLASRLADIALVKVATRDGTATMVREDGRWTMREKDGYPASFAEIRNLVLGLASARIVEAKTDDPTRYRRLDLDDPDVEGSRGKRVEIATDDGPLLTVVIGKTRYGLYGAGRAGTYVRVDGQPRAWLVDREIAAPATPLSYVDRQVIDLPVASIARIELVDADHDPVRVARNDRAAPLALEAVPEGRSADPEKLDRLAAVLASLQLQDVRKADPALFGDLPPRGRVTTIDGVEVAVRLARLGEGDAAEHWLTLEVAAGQPLPADGATADPPLAERVADLRQRLDGWAYRISPWLAERLRWGVSDLLLPEGTS